MNKYKEQAIEIIRGSRRIAALSGAGISTEAGIPDFRGPGGMWEDEALMDQLSASGFRRDPAGFYRASLDLFQNISHAQPTLAHFLLAKFEEMGKMEAVITQNIDGLHQRAGSKRVYELHGTYRTGRCVGCGAAYRMDAFYKDLELGKLQFPLCTDCGSPIKPDVVLFGDLLPFDAWEASQQAAERCDLMLVFGSSLIVYPAAELPHIAIGCGAQLIIVNLEATSYDQLATLTVREKLGNFAQNVLDRL